MLSCSGGQRLFILSSRAVPQGLWLKTFQCGIRFHLTTSSNWLDGRRQASFQASEAGLQPNGHLPIGEGHEENKVVPWQRLSQPTIKSFQSHFCMLFRKDTRQEGSTSIVRYHNVEMHMLAWKNPGLDRAMRKTATSSRPYKWPTDRLTLSRCKFGRGTSLSGMG
jgi:hypothetical protein